MEPLAGGFGAGSLSEDRKTRWHTDASPVAPPQSIAGEALRVYQGLVHIGGVLLCVSGASAPPPRVKTPYYKNPEVLDIAGQLKGPRLCQPMSADPSLSSESRWVTARLDKQQRRSELSTWGNHIRHYHVGCCRLIPETTGLAPCGDKCMSACPAP